MRLPRPVGEYSALTEHLAKLASHAVLTSRPILEDCITCNRIEFDCDLGQHPSCDSPELAPKRRRSAACVAHRAELAPGQAVRRCH